MDICFSATASFSAGIALCAVGAITIRRAGTPAERPYAAVPLIFGIQQCVEGGLWLALPAQAPAGPELTSHLLTITYLLFSNVLWPIYIPVAVWMIEPRAARRRTILFPMAAGAATSLYFLAAIIAHPVSATIDGAHISYLLPHAHETIAFTFYAAATCLAPLLSSHKTVRLLGGVIIVSMIAAYLVYWMWFTSVWCFFAAVASCVVFLHFAGQRPRGSRAAPIRPGPISTRD